MYSTQDAESILETAALEGVVFPPSDLLSDEPPLETEFHLRQMILLIQCLELWWRDRQDFYTCGNMTIYYTHPQQQSKQFRGPDFFVVLGTERKPRKSWMVWEENGKYPNVIVEILSGSTASVDRGVKKQIYQDIFRTPEYFWFDPISSEFKGFQLTSGLYQDLQPNNNGWLWSQQLELYLGIQEAKLRFFTAEGQLIPTPEERSDQEEQRAEQAQQRAEQAQQRAEQAQQQAEQAQQRAEQAQQQAERLAAQLREMGIEPSEL